MTTPTEPAEALRLLCRDGVMRAQSPQLGVELASIAGQLESPLQLAVAGAVSAGKSTLINALLGRPVAPADAGECTRLVTWYEYGAVDGRVLVECRSGMTHERRLEAGRLPQQLGVPVEDIARLRVQLADPWLRTVTVIDTPGVNTVSTANEEATRRLLFGDSAAEHAQALIYVLRYVQRFDADTLTEFRSLSAACGMTAVNTAAVLTQVDRRGDEDDPWPTARRLAERAASELRGTVLDVAPVIGLLAEAGRGRLLGPAELTELAELAALPPDDVDDLLLDVQEFADDPVRATLVARLHRYGIREAVAYLRDRPGCDAAELHQRLVACSGYGGDGSRPGSNQRGVAEMLDRFARHAGALKAFSAMVRLRRISAGPHATPADRALVGELRDAVDEQRPVAEGLRGLRILAACSAVSHGQLRLSPEMTDELMTLSREDDPAAKLGLPPGSPAAAVLAAALEASRRWRRVALLAGPTTGGHRARDVLGALEDMAAAADAAGSGEETAVDAPVSTLDPASGSPELDRAALTRLIGSPLLTRPERSALTTLLAATDLRGLFEPAEAAWLAGRFRALMHRPLPGPERRAAQVACDVFESIVHGNALEVR